jgi:peptide/nickel transport system permease protein
MHFGVAMERFAFVLRRPLELVPVLFGVSLISFTLVHSIPGDPVRILLGSRATSDVIANVRAQYGLDEPLPVQYALFLKNLLEGEFGRSIVYKTGVAGVVFDRIGPTLALLAYVLVLAILIALALACIGALTAGRWPDRLVRMVSTIGLGLPAYWVGIVLVLFFSIGLGLFPTSGYGETWLAHLHHLFLPALTMALALAPVLARSLRATLVTELESDYAVAARARGTSRALIFLRHVLPNALGPAVTVLGINFGWLIGGTVVIEQVFALPGIGALMVGSIFARDYLVVQLVALVLAVGVIVTNLLVDIVVAAVDPRIRA